MKKHSSPAISANEKFDDVESQHLPSGKRKFVNKKNAKQYKKSFTHKSHSKNKFSSEDERKESSGLHSYKRKIKPSRKSSCRDEENNTARKNTQFNKSLKGNRKALREGKKMLDGRNPVSYVRPKRVEEEQPKVEYKATFPMPLNKYIAHCGVCSRREAASIVKEERVKVNSIQITNPGHKVHETDTVYLDKKLLSIKQELVYIVLNKPKGYICTKDDEKNRKTIFELIDAEVATQLHSIGRLDRDTTGVLLLTNDGELTQRLSHPSYMVSKLYHVELDKPLTATHSQSITDGVTLEDGLIAADELAYTNPTNKKHIGLLLHSGRNRIVRRIFEHLGYTVTKLDRVTFAGITKKNIARSHWRLLTAVEVRNLKNFNPIYQQKKQTINYN